MENQTFFFYIVAFSNKAEERFLFFTVFFLLYVGCIIFNIMIVTIIFLEPRLHTPMCFFLFNLSFVDIFYISATLPKLLDILLTGDNRIPFVACFVQLYFFIFLGSAEIFLLTTMSYDRYVAICQPLRYVQLMEKKKCSLFAAGCWIVGCFNSIFVTVFASKFSFCGSRNINHIFCDTKVLALISCFRKWNFEMMIYLETLVVGVCPFSLILISYFKIIHSILKLNTLGQSSKTFSTCITHLIVLLTFYGTLFCMYMRAPSESSEQLDLIFSILYLAVTPTLNPLIYSLRNNDIKVSLRKIIKMHKS